MYPPPAGPELTAEQARELDDTFLASDPFAYFRSRIASLITWADAERETSDSALQSPPGTVRSAFNGYLQRAAAAGPFPGLDVDAQVAADALAVRHHAAEALLRLACARLAPSTGGATSCLWAEIATGPNQIVDVLARLHESRTTDDSGQRFFRAIVPASDRERVAGSAELVDAVNVYGEWLGYAGILLGPGQQIDLHGAHNKVKHGLAVRARADMRLTFTATGPDEDGSIPLSALTGPEAIDIFDQPVLELLARGPKADGHGQGLEVTQLRLNTAALLADAFMLAMTHGALFHVAAADHFDGRADLPDHVAPPAFPGYLLGGPRPKHIDSGSPLGMRYLLTNPPGGQAPARETGIGFRTYFQPIDVDHEGRGTGHVVDG